MLDESEEHRAMQRISGKCDKTIARRIYIRSSHLSVQELEEPREYRNNKSAIKQEFIPIGVICLSCGYLAGSPAGTLGINNSRKEIKRALRIGLDKLSCLEPSQQIEVLEKHSEDLKTEVSKIPRAQRRRAQREQERVAKLQNKYNLKETEVVR